ncbi:MAG: hypothetical protein JW940_05040 [Polyangiaceae bacterium]|nr:hypothetical protein [Polyangiaceae bacterium]
MACMVGWGGLLVLGWACSSEPANPNGPGGSGCQAGQMQCGGVCVSVQSDASNCGFCGNICPSGTTCVSGSCACQNGFVDCGSGCVNTKEDASNCGQCGKVCSGATPVCSNGLCSGSCAVGKLCGSSCVDTQTSIQHCGECDHACSGGQVCVAGGVPLVPAVVFTGGCAHNPCLVSLLSSALGHSMVVWENPQTVAALGCARIRLSSTKKRRPEE